MENGKVRVGIIGCGGIANGKHLPGLKSVPEVEMVAFCDIIVERAEAACKAYGTADAKFYENYKDLLADESIDVVHVCTPNISHSFITVDALEAGKHVMCEKPMAINSEEALKMLEAAKRTGKKLSIGYQNRQRPDSLYLKDICDRGDLGEIYFAKAHAIRRRFVPTWGVFLKEEEQGGGPLIDIGTHALDLTLWTMNNYKPKYCVGTTYHKFRYQTQTANACGDWNPDEFTVEDSAFGFVVMENGATIVLESAWALNTLDVREAKTTLCGTQGGADMVNGLRINGVDNNRMFTKNIDLDVGGVDFYSGNAGGAPHEREAYQWIHCIIDDTEPLVLPEQAYVVTQILEGIYESAKTGKAVYFN
ncbi:MAG: Gfo/Idh/MocA family oxidoreductase [Ruminococcaceae bacterium]|nr:Gfo/Idh/MocA family oxidoreductase [Oscillospiraceae bacterium]